MILIRLHKITLISSVFLGVSFLKCGNQRHHYKLFINYLIIKRFHPSYKNEISATNIKWDTMVFAFQYKCQGIELN